MQIFVPTEQNSTDIADVNRHKILKVLKSCAELTDVNRHKILKYLNNVLS